MPPCSQITSAGIEKHYESKLEHTIHNLYYNTSILYLSLRMVCGNMYRCVEETAKSMHTNQALQIYWQALQFPLGVCPAGQWLLKQFSGWNPGPHHQ